MIDTEEPPIAAEQAPDSSSRSRSLGSSVAAALNVLGRVLIGSGVLVLLFVVYQLWGTNLQERRSQSAAKADFTEQLAQVDAFDDALLESLRNPPPSSPTATTAPPLPTELVSLLTPQPGEPMALIRIPKIGVEKVVVQGVSTDDLKKGPGHYDESPLPGQAGNAAIAGHRTTYGAPFHNLDQLVAGDEIAVTTVLGTATYRVSQEPFVVTPDQVEVLDEFGDNRLTLTSCHPKYSARERLIVTAVLVGEPFGALPEGAAPVQVETVVTTPDGLPATTVPSTTVAPTTEAPPTTESTTTTTTAAAAPRADLDQGLGGDSTAWPAVIGWGLVSALVGALAWVAARWWSRRGEGRARLRRWSVYAVASPFFLVVLYMCFENVDRLLPAY